MSEVEEINRLIEDAKRDLKNGDYTARDRIKRLQQMRIEANEREVNQIRFI